ncbi:hypothetical protein D1831_03410 [Lactiplantibacillus garii]|uniref:Uncharacterized protein n=1 Tax=Lactiplantibacillus garii TaxID=2306423 RepID=A0A426D9P0_9LACO|nr:hypothetical protein [Lactiplantibacillus garii]RRK11287.1 hypothetical protein D1831_03410 [Lactiplantibacillus garii]
MKDFFASQSKTNKGILIVSVMLMLIEPWLMLVNTTVGLALAGTGIIGFSTYLEFLPYFRQTVLHWLLLILILIGLLLVLIVYSFAVLAAFGA